MIEFIGLRETSCNSRILSMNRDNYIADEVGGPTATLLQPEVKLNNSF